MNVHITKCDACAKGLRVDEATLETPLETIFAGQLSVRVRVRNAFNTYQIWTVGDVLRRSPSDLLKMSHFGRKSLDEVEACMNSIGLSVGGGVSRASASAARQAACPSSDVADIFASVVTRLLLQD